MPSARPQGQAACVAAAAGLALTSGGGRCPRGHRTGRLRADPGRSGPAWSLSGVVVSRRTGTVYVTNVNDGTVSVTTNY